MGFVAEVEVVTQATGKVVPAGQVKVLRATSSERVAQLAVKDGQSVEEGDLLIQLDDGSLVTRRDQLIAELDMIRSRETALRHMSTIEFADLVSGPTVGADAQRLSGMSSVDRRWLMQRLAAESDGMASSQRQINTLERERRVLKVQLDRAVQVALIMDTRLQRGRLLRAGEAISEFDAQTTEIQSIDASASAQEIEAQLALLATRMHALSQDKQDHFRRFQLDVTESLQLYRERSDDLFARLKQVEHEIGRARIVAPRSGVVDGLQIHAEDVYVNAGDALLTLVPANDQLIVEVMLPSREAGFVRAGQTARIKVDAFPYTRYGSVSADLIYISGDATPLSDQPGLFYKARLALREVSFEINGHPEPIHIGMSASAEIITETRPLLDFFIAPIKVALMEALRER
ncbi:MAG: HlyD family type I secretion periplasmic adaptor subunit [Pseudomonadota bacterium]